eukprot:TRINITY_DN21506_c0_g1_i1.p2 TRINITY_DN21506_c0_g1~~TRINITY_DN21506_c0_g1_i1.p2  ORF type:complete len:577 (+),score=218.12 TRINITY_DN21506_c0_g1_i1:1909-3639(+)
MARKNPDNRSKLRKDPGLPNSWPGKEEFLQKAENHKAKLEAEKQKQKDARHSKVMTQRTGDLASMAADASARAAAHNKKEGERNVDNGVIGANYGIPENSRKAYFRDFKKIVDLADVVLFVLDARDPLGCRCPEIEQRILQKDANKKIILILNKIDLIPKENVKQWLTYLRNEYPTLAMKCSTQTQRKDIGQREISNRDIMKTPDGVLASSEALGTDSLMQLLKNYSRNLNLKTAITVGIIGYPNVGKSSLINSLKRSKAVGVGGTPGFTKNVQEVTLDKQVKLLDCPGIVFGSNPTADVVLRNAVKLEKIKDVMEPVEAIFKRCRPEQLSKIYQIPLFNTGFEFLSFIAQKRGKLLKGGRIDLQAAGRSVLQDWNIGKIPFYTIPPKRKDVHISASIVNNWSKEFDIASLDQQQDSIIDQYGGKKSDNMMEMEAGQADTFEMDDDDDMEDEELDEEGDEEGMEDDDDESVTSGKTFVSDDIISRREQSHAAQLLSSATGTKSLASLFPEEAALNPQKKNKKKQQKKNKKLQKQNVSDEEDDGNDSFDFSRAFAFKDDADDADDADNADDIDIDDI